MMGFDNIIIGFIISYVAGSIPSLKEIFAKKNKNSLEDYVCKGYKQAVAKWVNNNPIRQNVAVQKLADISQFNELFDSDDYYSVSILKELIQLWAVELGKDEECYQVIRNIEIQDLSEKIEQFSKQIARRENKSLPIIKRGLTQHKPVEGYIRRYCSSDSTGSNFLGYLLGTKERRTLSDYVTNIEKLEGNKYILYSSAQYGKTTELKQLCWELQESGLYLPVIFEVRNNTNLKRENLPDFQYYGEKEIVVVIDALDEVNGQKYDGLLEEICGYAYDHPDIKVVLSCRSNYRREKQLENFKELFLEELSGEDIREYVTQKLGKIKGQRVITLMIENQLYDFAKIPFFLNVLIDTSSKGKPLPKTKAEIYKLFIESSYYKEKTEKNVLNVKEHNLEESIVLLERAALGMSLLNAQSLSREELQECLFNDSDNMEECLRFDLLRREDGNQYSFKYNAFREWLVANYLSRAGLSKAIEFATHPNGRIKPEWYNIIMLWVSMYGKDKKEEISAILDWLKECSLELVIYIDKDMLDERTRNEIFKGLLLEYKSLGIRMSNIMTQDYKNLLSFAQSDDTVGFLAEEIADSALGTAYFIDLLCFCYFLDWDTQARVNKALTDKLFNSLMKKTTELLSQKKSYDLSFIYLENKFFAGEEYFDQVFSLIKDSNHYEAIRAMIGLIDLADKVDEYVDYILDKEKYVHNQTDGNTTHIVTRSCVYKTLNKVHSLDGVKKILSHNFYNTQSYYQEDKEEYCCMMKNALTYACGYIKDGHLELADILEVYFTRYYENYRFYFDSDSYSQELFQNLRNCYIESGLRDRGRKSFYDKLNVIFNNLNDGKPRRDDLHKIFHLAGLWMTEQDVKADFSRFSPSESIDFCKASWYSEVPYKEVAECAAKLFDELFPRTNTYEKGRERRRKSFEDFADYAVFKQVVLEMALGLDEHTSRREYNKRLRELEEGYNVYAFRFFLCFAKGSDEYDIQAIIKGIKDADFYEAFFMKEIAEMLEHSDPELLISDEIIGRCISAARTIVTRLCENKYPGFFWEVAIKLMLKGLFDLPAQMLPGLIDYGWVNVYRKDESSFYTSEYSLFEYIVEHADEDTLIPIILGKLEKNVNNKGYKLSYPFSKYIIDNSIEEGYELALKFALSGEYYSNNILDAIIKKQIKVDEIQKSIDDFDVSNRLFCYSELARDPQWQGWVKQKLEFEFKSLEGYSLHRATSLLLSVGSLEALNHLQMNPDILLHGDNFHFNYDDINAVPLLCYFLKYIQEHKFDEPFVQNSILSSLERIGIQSEDALIEVKLYLRKLIQEGEDYKYLNRIVMSMENKYYETYNGVKCIKDAMKIVDADANTDVDTYQGKDKNEDEDDGYIYISYNWEGESSRIVDYLCFVLEVAGIPYKLDKKDCHYTENIKEFMNAIRTGKLVIVVFSRPYMKSKNCMYELSGIMENSSYKERILPVVVDDTIRNSKFYIELVEFWKAKKDEIEDNVNRLRAIDPDMAEPEENELNEVEHLYGLLKEIKQYVDWANASNISILCSERFKPLIDIIRARMKNNIQYKFE